MGALTHETEESFDHRFEEVHPAIGKSGSQEACRLDVFLPPVTMRYLYRVIG
jgi:hypothetical protein